MGRWCGGRSSRDLHLPGCPRQLIPSGCKEWGDPPSRPSPTGRAVLCQRGMGRLWTNTFLPPSEENGVGQEQDKEREGLENQVQEWWRKARTERERSKAGSRRAARTMPGQHGSSVAPVLSAGGGGITWREVPARARVAFAELPWARVARVGATSPSLAPGGFPCESQGQAGETLWAAGAESASHAPG